MHHLLIAVLSLFIPFLAAAELPSPRTTVAPGSDVTTTTTRTTTSTTSTTSLRLENCYVGGPCDCSKFQPGTPEYLNCITNPNCRDCFLSDTLTPRPSTTTTSSSRSRSATPVSPIGSSPVVVLPSGARDPGDNCWIGGPCDCSLLEKDTEPWRRCIIDPNCDHCWVNGSGLTSRASVPTAWR